MGWASRLLRPSSARALPQKVLTAARPAQKGTVSGDNLAAGERQHGHARHGEGVEGVVAGTRVQPTLVDNLHPARVEEDKVGVAADRHGTFPRIEAEYLG